MLAHGFLLVVSDNGCGFHLNGKPELVANGDAIVLPSAANEDPPEPMVNIAVYFDNGQWTAIVFPRSKHRPRVYETGEFTVSPATIDLCGVLVVPVEKDFYLIHGPDIERIFKEVTMRDDAFSTVLDRLALEGRS